MAIRTIALKEFTCDVCDYVWLQTKKKLLDKNYIPISCAYDKCSSKYWNGMKFRGNTNMSQLLLSKAQIEKRKIKTHKGKRE